MTIERRGFLRLLGRVAALLAGAVLWPPARRGLAATTLTARTAKGRDAAALQAIMTSSVADDDAFFGKCGEWSLGWAEDMVARCPDSVVLSVRTTPVAFLEIPPIGPPLAPPAVDASAAERERYALRARNRATFRVSAAGVRDDLLSFADSVAVFRTLLFAGFRHARELGYDAVEAVAPWERHPRMTRKWTDYPGCTLVEPVSRAQGEEKDLYWLRWRLDEALTALAAEGVGAPFAGSLRSDGDTGALE